MPEIWVDDFEARYPEETTEIGRFREMHDWVVSTKDNLEKFKMEFENYFDMHFSLIYYVYTFFALMVDQRAKNMFLTYWGETDKWYPYFYDNDTCFGINNEGQLVLDYFHEDTDLLAGANVYNGQNSVLWCNFRDAFPDEIKATYQDLRSNGVLNYDELIDQFITKGSDKWSESIYNEDADFKYISMLYEDGDASNLGQVRGTGEEHLRYFIENRINYCDGKWYASDYADDYVALRIYTPSTWAGVEPNADITVTPYSHMYAGVRYKANGTLYQKRVSANEVTKFEAPNETFNDTETAIYGASQLSSLGDLSPLYCGSINVSKAEKLTELIIGSNAEGYSNPNLNDLSVGTNNLLKVLNVRNCSSLTDPLALSGCPNIEEIYAAGSGITGVELANSGYLKTIELPATITNLSLKNQLYIESLTFEGYATIKTINIENCPTVDGLDILSKATNVERVRLTNVNWSYDTAAEVLALADRNLAGIDENGANIDYMWIDGKCHIKTLTGAEYLEVKEAFPYMTITYDNLTAELIFMSEDGNTELTRQTIQNGGDGTDPVTAGTISKPTKESTAQYNFTYSGWSLTPGGVADPNALKNVEADRTVYVAFSKELRSYTVRFYNGTTLLQTSTVQYGGDAVYSGSTPVNNSSGNPADFEFYGWSPAPTNIQGDTSCYAQFHDLREITDSWETIAAAVADGTATSKYSIGAFKQLDIGAKDLPYSTYLHASVIFGDNIYIFGGSLSINSMCYRYNESGWVEDSKMPNNFYQGCSAVVYNNEVHVMGGNNKPTIHYKYDGLTWSEVSTLPYGFEKGRAIIYNNEIHILGGTGNKTAHYKWTGTEWISVSVLPYEFPQGDAVVYNNEIHILGGNGNKTAHYKWTGTEWISVSVLPYLFNRGNVVVYNNEIHILGGNATKHYKWDGNVWTEVSKLPYIFNEGSTVTKNNEIYILGGDGNKTGFYYFDGSKWTPVGTTESIPMQIVAHNHDELPDGVGKWEPSTPIPYGFYQGSAVMLNGEVHILGTNYSSKYQTYHYKYDGSTWVSVSTLPYAFYYGSAVVYNDEIHILGGSSSDTNHYKWNATDGWVSVSTLPYNFYRATAIVFNNEIHIMGSAHTSYRLVHYKWDGSAWTSVGAPPYGVQDTCAVVLNNELHILGSFMSGKDTCHYKYDGSAWTEVSTLPYAFYNGSAVVYNNEIHILGGYGGSEPYTQHYKWNGNEWVEDTTLPYDFYRSCALVYNNKITLLGSGLNKYSKYFYQLTGASWKPIVTLDTVGSNVRKFFTFKDDLYLIKDNNRTDFYKLDGADFVYVGELPYKSYSSTGFAEYNNELYMFGGNSSNLYLMYKWDGSTWTQLISDNTSNSLDNCDGFVYDGKLHIIARYSETKHYVWDGTTLTTDVAMPHGRRNGINIMYNGEIHILGGMTMPTKHLKWNGTEWVSVSTLPYSVNGTWDNEKTDAFVYDNRLFLCGEHAYEFVDGEWVELNWYQGLSDIIKRKRIYLSKNRLYCIPSSNSFALYRYENPRATLTFFAGNLLKDKTYKFNNAKKLYDGDGLKYWTSGGWPMSDLRVLLNGDFLNTLPSDLVSSITEVKKLSDSGYPQFEIATSEDKVWLLSVSEVGITNNTYPHVNCQGEAYSVFTNYASRMRRTVDGLMDHWYTRSTSGASIHAVVSTDGGVIFGDNKARYICIGFCI